MVLVFEQDILEIKDPKKFGFQTMTDLYRRAGYDKICQNSTSIDYKERRYMPCLTLSRRIVFGKPQLALRVQFSVPKALYKNNFDEVEDSDFPKVVDWLHNILSEKMGVFVLPHYIEQAKVSVIHYGKNLVFENSLRCQYILQKIEKANMTKRLGFNKCNYDNGGCCIKYRTNSFELVFYDKIKDLEQARNSPKKSEEKGDTVIQLNLLSSLLEVKREVNLEVLRMEVRLNRRNIIKKKLLEAGTVTDDLTFKNLFKKEWSKAVLINQLDGIQKQYPIFLEDISDTSEDFLLQFQIDNPKATISEIMTMYGMKELFKTKGPREIREMFRLKNDDQWYRFYKKINMWVTKGKLLPMFPAIRQQLEVFESVKLIDYPNLISNDDRFK